MILTGILFRGIYLVCTRHCPRSKWPKMKCYDSCPHCDADSSCDWTSCHDDLAYTRAVVEAVAAAWCLDLDSLHMSGLSNGGMFSYYAASRCSPVSSRYIQ